MIRNQTTFLRVGMTLSVLAGVVLLGYAAAHTFSCLLLSFVIAYLLDPFVVFLERRRIKRTHGILVIYTLMAVTVFFGVTILLPIMSSGWDSLLRDIPRYYGKAQSMILALKGRFGHNLAVQEWAWLLDSIQSGLDRVIGHIGAGAYAAASRLVLNLFNLLLAPVLVFFMLFYKEEAKEGMGRLIPDTQKSFVLAVARDINDSIGGFIRGQLIVSLIVAVISSLAMLFLKVNHPIFCGVFAGIASIIPFVGVVIATLPPLFFTSAEFQGVMPLVKVAAAFAVIYFIEGYVIKPLVFKKSMDLNPLVTIIMVMLMGEVLGLWGIILAIPCAGAIRIFYAHLRREGEQSPGTNP